MELYKKKCGSNVSKCTVGTRHWSRRPVVNFNATQKVELQSFDLEGHPREVTSIF